MTNVATMMTCWWSGRHLGRYLDADPSAPLSEPEVARLEHHLSICSRCATSMEEQLAVKQALSRVRDRLQPDPARVARLGDIAARLRSGDLS